jgi:hypothetical protein
MGWRAAPQAYRILRTVQQQAVSVTAERAALQPYLPRDDWTLDLRVVLAPALHVEQMLIFLRHCLFHGACSFSVLVCNGFPHSRNAHAT